MKCALELKVMRTEADERHRLEELALDEECRTKHQTTCQNTIELCEEIGKIFEQQATERKDIFWDGLFIIKRDRLEHRLLVPLTEGRKYADGRQGYDGVWDSGKYDLDIFNAYLEKHCFKLSLKKTEFWVYGWGKHEGYTLTVVPAPECMATP